MSEFSDEEEQIWEDGLNLLLKEKQYESALSLFNYLFNEGNVTGRARGILLTGIAEAEFGLGRTDKAIHSNLKSIKFFPGKRSTYRRTMHMARTSNKHIIVLYVRLLYVINFFKILSDVHYVISNNIDVSRI